MGKLAPGSTSHPKAAIGVRQSRVLAEYGSQFAVAEMLVTQTVVQYNIVHTAAALTSKAAIANAQTIVAQSDKALTVELAQSA